MRLFSSDRIAGVMDKLGFKEGEMIEHSMISKSIERAQKKVEEAYKDEKGWARMAMLNTACAGKFTSDRTIQEYVDDIWHLDKVFVK